MDVASWISAGAAAISVVGGAIGYYQTKLSKRARAEAVEEREKAQRAEQRAIEAAATTERHLKAAEHQVQVLEQHLPAIATAVEKSGTDLQNSLTSGGAIPQPRIEWIKGSQYAIINPLATTLQIDTIQNKNEFVRLSLEPQFDVAPSSQMKFIASGAAQLPLPDNLVLNEVGRDAPLYLPIPPKC